MSLDYINEAFKRLELLDEAMFDTSLKGINELSNLLDQEEPKPVIDPEATSEEELQNSYVGKVIINCNVCHSHIFKDKLDIVIDENNAVNAEDNCPYCNEAEGFTIIGEITPFNNDESTNTSDAENPVETKEDTPMEDSGDTSSIEEGLSLGGATNLANSIMTPGANLASKMLFDEYDNDTEEDAKQSRATRRMTEDFKEDSITTDDQHMEMTSDETGKVTVTTEPINNDKTNSEEMTISPASEETLEDIFANNEVDSDSEEPDSEESDVEFDEIDEEGLDELGESYFHNVYDNVSSFKTTSVGANDSAILVEGVIEFTSGAKKKTGFIFEAKDFNKQGKLRFIGSNKQICESTDAFTLVGSIKDKKLFVESLKYNYCADETPVRGVVRRK